MKNENNISKPRTTRRKAVGQAIAKQDKENLKTSIKDSQEIQDAIRIKAYELYLEGGCQQGCEVENWVAAERIVRQDLA